MSRQDDNKKIAEWLGLMNESHCPKCGTPWSEMGDVDYHVVTLCKGQFIWEKIPNYTTSDSATIQLLPLLVEQGYKPELAYTNEWHCQIWGADKRGWITPIIADGDGKPTIAQAISKAVLALIDRTGEE